MISKDASNQKPTALASPIDAAPPSYDTVAFSYGDDVPEADKMMHTSRGSSSRTSSPSSPRREFFTVAVMPPGSEKMEKEKDALYHYTDPDTGALVPTYMPPEHPEMQCLQSGHVTRTRFGPLGIAAAVLWFPFGLGALWVDRTVSCQRCQRVLKDGALRGCGKANEGRCGARKARAKARYLGEDLIVEKFESTRRRKRCCGKRKRQTGCDMQSE